MKHITLRSGILFSLLVLGACQSQKPAADTTISTGVNNDWSINPSNAYSLYPNRVVQGEFEAKAISPTELTSNYKSPANLTMTPTVVFKFAINGRDNEMAPGTDHIFNCIPSDGKCVTPVITFGKQVKADADVPKDVYLTPNTKMTVRLDMRPVLEAFKKQGAYTSPTGDKIYKEDFKGVFIAGGTDPLSWDFDNLGSRKELQLQDPDGDGIYEITLLMNENREEKMTAQQWKMTRDASAFPQYQSEYMIADALHNLALEEMINAVEPDSTFRTGKEWAGVWTRDISYSIILSMAQVQPKVSMYSLMRKVKDGRIVQDTGTGGAYPISTDRVIWAVAAWEVYKATGDEKWLRDTYAIIKKSLQEDQKNAFNPETGMMRGESSFLDWREQTYPRWMQPADIYESENLGTNAAHYQANIVAAQMADILKDIQAAAEFRKSAESIKQGINKYLWVDKTVHYGQYLYGRNYKILSPRAEALGAALSVIYGVADADRSRQVVMNTPLTDFGITSIFPQIPGIPPYHNNAVWPFVQSYWALAAAKVGNEESLTASIAAIYRPAALFLTNKENFVATNGDYAGTQVNSSNMLWSLAGSLSLVYKVYFGMDLKADGIELKPFVPKAFAGNRKLTNYKYRNAILNFEMSGHGNQIKSITMDGKPMEKPFIPATLTGTHTIKIELANNEVVSEFGYLKVRYSPDMPKVKYVNGQLTWPAVEGAEEYHVYKNGKWVEQTKKTTYTVDTDNYGEYMVMAVDSDRSTSFGSEPVMVVPGKYKLVYEVEKAAPKSSQPYRDFSGTGFIEISKQKNKYVKLTITVPEDGVYAIDFRYANGNGPINTSNKAAIRTLNYNGRFAGTIVLPQRGDGEWSNWGFTNAVDVQLPKGSHTISLTFEPHNENMHGEVNQAMLDYMRVIKIR
ncbi:glycogen debranching protein [Pontibacter sp. KCTC 32443]|uniref:alpha-L-rhamnosidase-related protein n=1 Tax=Pontibacter TaxID=323449 RepID=UPI00164E206D|nr:MULTISPECIES: glycogen debranching protein [Pontibacter]MBC5772754.1 glycogen debranching protein [Pontibacter sp. KCTC 32443]